MARCVTSYPYPLAPQPLGDRDRCAAAAERVEHHVALVAACHDDALQQRLRLLRGVVKSFIAQNRRNIVPQILQGNSGHLVCELHQTGHAGLSMNEIPLIPKVNQIGL